MSSRPPLTRTPVRAAALRGLVTRRAWTAVAALLVVVALGAVLVPRLLIAPPAPVRSSSTSPPPSSVETVPARSLRVTPGERVRLLALFAQKDAEDDRRLASRFQSAVDVTADSPYPADGRGARAVQGIVATRSIGPSSTEVRDPAGGAVTVGVVLSRPAPWRAELLLRDGRRAAVTGTTLGGRLQYGLVIVPDTTGVVSIALEVPSDVDCAWQVLRRG